MRGFQENLNLSVLIYNKRSNLFDIRCIAATHRCSLVQSYSPGCANVHPIYRERQKWLTWQRPLVAGYRQYLHFVGRPLKPPPYQLPSGYRSLDLEIKCLSVVIMATNFGTKISIAGFV